MAKKIDNDFLNDTRTENRKEGKKFSSDTTENFQTQDPPPQQKTTQNQNEQQQTSQPGNAQNTQANSENLNPPPIDHKDEFRERYDDFFKGMDGMIAGDMVIGLIDDLKANFLYLYAKKNNISGVGKKEMEMDDKSRKFAAFLVDHAIKNNFFETIKKYPLLAALGVILISGGSTFAMLQMLKSSNNTAKSKDEEIEKLKKDLENLRKKKYETAETVSEESDTENSLVAEYLKTT
jgi:hypothetical protein